MFIFFRRFFFVLESSIDTGGAAPERPIAPGGSAGTRPEPAAIASFTFRGKFKGIADAPPEGAGGDAKTGESPLLGPFN